MNHLISLFYVGDLLRYYEVIRYYLQTFGISIIQSSLNNSKTLITQFFSCPLKLYKNYITRKIHKLNKIRVIETAVCVILFSNL